VVIDDRTEWLDADGLGGFASGTVSGVRTRRYHALLLSATTPPTGRLVLVNGFEAWAEDGSGRFALTTQRYSPNVLHPDGADRIASFTDEPWPKWELRLGDHRIRQEIFVQHGKRTVAVSWTLLDGGPMVLYARPLMSGRDYHSTHHENGAFRFEPRADGDRTVFEPYAGIPAIAFQANGTYEHAPEWYRNFVYSAEAERGLDAAEDLASPGVFTWRLASANDRAIWLMSAGDGDAARDTVGAFNQIIVTERNRRSAFRRAIDRAVDAYIVRRGHGKTIVAGYPWFTDWGRDTFIAIRGLCLASGRLIDARDILVEWAGAVSEGMLPNRFPDDGEVPEFNSVDASLWFVIAAAELLRLTARRSQVVSRTDRDALQRAILAIASGYSAGTRFGIRMDDDGLLRAGVPGVQLTWMDARVGDRVITPRIGKPVEVQALWLNALHIAGEFDLRFRNAFERGRAAFAERFWLDARGHLADVVDLDHVTGQRDETFRPNQVLAVGGLPLALLEGAQARRVVDAVEQRLVTSMGLRSLAPGEPGYASRYIGDGAARDAVYHQGTVWPWLLGPFVEAWVRVRGGTAAAKREARARFLEPMCAHLGEAGLGHVSEIADADAPFTPRGCPFQAWSLGEFVRLDSAVLAPAKRLARRPEPQLQCV
jgi:predicted glycogen debranching enzyme